MRPEPSLPVPDMRVAAGCAAAHRSATLDNESLSGGILRRRRNQSLIGEQDKSKNHNDSTINKRQVKVINTTINPRKEMVRNRVIASMENEMIISKCSATVPTEPDPKKDSLVMVFGV